MCGIIPNEYITNSREHSAVKLNLTIKQAIKHKGRICSFLTMPCVTKIQQKCISTLPDSSGSDYYPQHHILLTQEALVALSINGEVIIKSHKCAGQKYFLFVNASVLRGLQSSPNP